VVIVAGDNMYIEQLYMHLILLSVFTGVIMYFVACFGITRPFLLLACIIIIIIII
jgi:hypothetical protein